MWSCKWTAGLLIWARRPFFLPLSKEGGQLFGRVGGGCASGTGCPSPMNQFVVADMIRNRIDATSASAVGILDLRADFRACLAKPLHIRGRQQPDLGARRPMGNLRVRLAVASSAGKRLRANPAFDGIDVHAGRPRRHAARLGRHWPVITADMAIGAAGVTEHFMYPAPGFQPGILCVGGVRQRKQHDCDWYSHRSPSNKPYLLV